MRGSTNLLFVCTKNKWRSPTAEALYADHCNIHTRSAGTTKSARKFINVADIRWADIIFVMEYKHKRYLEDQFRHQLHHKTLIVLDIPDDYQYMDKELVEWLKESIDSHLSLLPMNTTTNISTLALQGNGS